MRGLRGVGNGRWMGDDGGTLRGRCLSNGFDLEGGEGLSGF